MDDAELIETMCIDSLDEAIRQRSRIEPFNELGPEEQALFRVVMRAALAFAKPEILEQAAKAVEAAGGDNADFHANVIRSLAKQEQTNG